MSRIILNANFLLFVLLFIYSDVSFSEHPFWIDGNLYGHGQLVLQKKNPFVYHDFHPLSSIKKVYLVTKVIKMHSDRRGMYVVVHHDMLTENYDNKFYYFSIIPLDEKSHKLCNAEGSAMKTKLLYQRGVCYERKVVGDLMSSSDGGVRLQIL